MNDSYLLSQTHYQLRWILCLCVFVVAIVLMLITLGIVSKRKPSAYRREGANNVLDRGPS